MSRTVRVPGKRACAPRPWQRISERICSLGKGQARPAVSGADRGADRELRPDGRLDGRPHGALPARARERLADVLAKAELQGLVLDADDALVVEADQQVEGDAALLRELLGQARVRRAGRVAEEVGPRGRIRVRKAQLLLGREPPERSRRPLRPPPAEVRGRRSCRPPPRCRPRGSPAARASARDGRRRAAFRGPRRRPSSPLPAAGAGSAPRRTPPCGRARPRGRSSSASS